MRNTLACILAAVGGVFGVVGCGSGGCLMPYVSIPARIEIGGLSAHGAIPVEQEGGIVTESDSANMLHLRAGLNPLQGFNGWHDRSWDIGAGYLAQWLWVQDDEVLVYQGFHLEGSWFPWSTTVGQNDLRLGLTGSAEVILSGFGAGDELGPGATLGATLEWTGTVEKSYSDTAGGGLGSSAAAIGALYGEWGIGAGVSVSYRKLFDRDFWTIFVGLSFRLPFGAGLFALSS